MTDKKQAEFTNYMATPLMIIAGNIVASLVFIYGLYYLVGIGLAIAMKDNRAFCKYLCPITVFLKGGTSISLLRIEGNKDNCDQCGVCTDHCIMDIDIPAYTTAGQRVKSSECVLCMQCVAACPQGLLKSSVGLDVVTKENWRKQKS